MKIETWKKIMIVFGLITSTIGYLLNSKLLIILGLISSILGELFIIFKL